MEADQQIRNLRDFLLVYNRMTETCFQRCSSNFNYRNLTMDEERCLDSCAGKLIRSNHRMMGAYVQLMPRMMQRRMDEMESKAAENAIAAEAAAAASLELPAADASSASQIPVAASLPPQIPALLPSVATDVGLEAQGSVIKPSGLDIPFELDAAFSKPTAATEVSFSAATLLTPATEAVNLPVFNEAASGPSFTEVFPQLPVASVQTESVSSMPVLMPSTTSSLSVDMPVSTVSAPTVSSQERAPEAPPASGQ
ncbi:mitochondrial import inner membrane translocase subunit Tim10 B isoform X1 [Hippoglossus hippoglossus]|uniref:mitochondrial import inner membrane translocase subunit Tim10 B isoform X1 n=1 Tax=Hippoglossus hippoglossus TaxID=8267 RepID=UPI00148DE64A|nr:mitochondrial import inner membrane translocase subunit Tim10 B isoform X1 [Hippoglossus hippoglossus]